jgi:Arc/MetJ-type ribon-helix-helix transcriptional regulator
MRYTFAMKTATIPSVRVEPEFRAEVEQVLGEGESMSQFVEAAVRACVSQRKSQAEFVARGMKSLASARRSGEYVDAGEVMQGLRSKLTTAKRQSAARR